MINRSRPMHQNRVATWLLVFVVLLLSSAFLAPINLFAISSGSIRGNEGRGSFRSDSQVSGREAEVRTLSETALVQNVPLFGRKWKLTEVDGAGVRTTKPYLQLDEPAQRFEGDGGCNRISGSAEVNANTVKFSRIISTKRACADRELQQVEVRFVAGLERATSFYIRGDVMRLYSRGVAILAFKTEAAGPVSKPGKPAKPVKPVSRTLQPNSLCEEGERIIFSCRLKRPARIVSLCSSPDLERERGYLQYRFGLPTRIELEFPKTRQSTQEQFQYSHYFRFQVDLTEINFTIDGNQYQIFDAYNGEEKPRVIQYGVMIVPEKRASLSYHCRTKPKADYSTLQDVLAP